MKMIRCPKCNGAGAIEDPATCGMRLRLARKKARKGLREVAEAMGISATFLHDMEVGNRGWTLSRIVQFTKAIKR